MILVTGFEPFGGEDTNPSALALGELAMDHDLKTQILPVDFAKAFELLKSAVNPEIDFILMLGQAGGSFRIKLESQAFLGPELLRNQLPLEKILSQTKTDLAPQGLHPWLEISHFAGNFVCNDLYFKVMKNLKSIPAMFVHMPYVPDQTLTKAPGTGALGIGDQVKIVRSLLRQIQ